MLLSLFLTISNARVCNSLPLQLTQSFQIIPHEKYSRTGSLQQNMVGSRTKWHDHRSYTWPRLLSSSPENSDEGLHSESTLLHAVTQMLLCLGLWNILIQDKWKPNPCLSSPLEVLYFLMWYNAKEISGKKKTYQDQN